MSSPSEPAGRGSDFGGWLRRQREARGIPLVDVSQRTRVKMLWLELIEANRTDQLPAEVFVRGFVRAYARAVGADESEASRLLSAHLAERRAEYLDEGEIVSLGRGRARGRRAVFLVVAALMLALVAVAALLWR